MNLLPESLIGHPIPAAFIDTFREISMGIYENASKHGFHGSPEQDNTPTKLMLVVSELAEALEADRHDGSLRSDHIPNFTMWEEELADAVIRLMDLGVMTHARLAEAIIVKESFNRNRPMLHGHKRY